MRGALQVLVELLDSLDGLSDGESGDESGESAAPANADGSGDISDGGESGDGNAPAALAGPLATLPAGALPDNVQQELISVLTEEPTAAAPAAPSAFTGRSFRLDD